ncbi:hypothetical protein FTUN_4911 [Frigoriglobus tundricola]|uniref:Uncharacterized protein n=1 Tax=Frigoriglobus tundricola TaxID=2774151 RepID=A0A6M5YVL2_9BACT|nr:hypothetical protein FTUN_4911 [Frigoriglobus tundricola]
MSSRIAAAWLRLHRPALDGTSGGRDASTTALRNKRIGRPFAKTEFACRKCHKTQHGFPRHAREESSSAGQAERLWEDRARFIFPKYQFDKCLRVNFLASCDFSRDWHSCCFTVYQASLTLKRAFRAEGRGGSADRSVEGLR